MTPEEEKPKRRRRRGRGGGDSEAAASSEAPHASASEAAPTSEPASAAESGEVAEVVAETADAPVAAGAEPAGASDDTDPAAEEELEDADEGSDDEDSEDEDSEDEDDEDELEGVADEAPGAAAKPARRRLRRGSGEPVEEAPVPAPARRRRERPPGPPPVVRAQAKYVRSSPRKARLVCDHIRGKSVEEARAILAHAPRAVAKDWSKLLESAVANAEHNHELVGEDLYVKAVHADDGPTIPRFRPRAMGRATKIRKRTSHLTILLTPKD